MCESKLKSHFLNIAKVKNNKLLSSYKYLCSIGLDTSSQWSILEYQYHINKGYVKPIQGALKVIRKRVWILYWFFSVVPLLCFQNTLMVINFKIFKYIKIIFKVPKQCQQRKRTLRKMLFRDLVISCFVTYHKQYTQKT